MNIKERAMDLGRFSEGFRSEEMFDRNRTEEKESVSATDW